MQTVREGEKRSDIRVVFVCEHGCRVPRRRPWLVLYTFFHHVAGTPRVSLSPSAGRSPHAGHVLYPGGERAMTTSRSLRPARPMGTTTWTSTRLGRRNRSTITATATTITTWRRCIGGRQNHKNVLPGFFSCFIYYYIPTIVMASPFFRHARRPVCMRFAWTGMSRPCVAVRRGDAGGGGRKYLLAGRDRSIVHCYLLSGGSGKRVRAGDETTDGSGCGVAVPRRAERHTARLGRPRGLLLLGLASSVQVFLAH